MKEYIDRELLLKETKEYRENDPWWAIRRWWDAYRRRRYFTLFGLVVSKFPAADVVEVVRCKDCKYYAAMITDTVSGDMETAPWGTCTQPWFNSDEYDVQENGYCSYGERKMDKEE